MKKRIVGVCMILIIGIVISLVSAVVMDYYGKVVQVVEVGGLVFYANNGESLTNEKPNNCNPYSFNNKGSRKFIINTTLTNIEFNVRPKVNFYIRANVNVVYENLTLIFGYNGGEICSINLIVNTTEDYNYGPVSCEASFIPLNITEIYYKIKGNCEDCRYQVDKCDSENFYSRMEVSPA